MERYRWSVRYRTNARFISAAAWRCCKTLIAELQSNNNKVTTHRPVDSKTGKPSTTAAVEWVPFSQPVKILDFENLFKQVDTGHVIWRVGNHERH